MKFLYLKTDNLGEFVAQLAAAKPPFVALATLDSFIDSPPATLTAVSARFETGGIITTFDGGPNIDGAKYAHQIVEAANAAGVLLRRGHLQENEPLSAVAALAARSAKTHAA